MTGNAYSTSNIVLDIPSFSWEDVWGSLRPRHLLFHMYCASSQLFVSCHACVDALGLCSTSSAVGVCLGAVQMKLQ